jgi:hypothetical protein
MDIPALRKVMEHVTHNETRAEVDPAGTLTP